MFLGPWNEVKKKPQTLIYWGFLEPRSSPRLLKPYLLILGAENQKPRGCAGASCNKWLHTSALRMRRQYGQGPHFRGHSGEPPSIFDVESTCGPVLTPQRSHVLYIYPLLSRFKKKKDFRIDFFSLV